MPAGQTHKQHSPDKIRQDQTDEGREGEEMGGKERKWEVAAVVIEGESAREREREKNKEL
jgi:hypothetical protein